MLPAPDAGTDTPAGPPLAAPLDVPLDAPSAAALAAALAAPLDAVLAARRSIREHDPQRPLTVAQLGEFLHRSARVTGVGMDGRHEISRRPSPSGGALHGLEIYPVISNVDGLATGMYHYDPFDHVLEPVPARGAVTRQLLAMACAAAAGADTPQALLVLSCRFGRVMWKYQGLGYALVLKDVGRSTRPCTWWPPPWASPPARSARETPSCSPRPPASTGSRRPASASSCSAAAPAATAGDRRPRRLTGATATGAHINIDATATMEPPMRRMSVHPSRCCGVRATAGQ